VNREAFERRHAASWERLTGLLKELERGSASPRTAAELPRMHRRCCHHLALARRRHLGTDLEERLNDLAVRGHQQLYRSRTTGASRAFAFLVHGFPRLVRSEARLFWLATLLLYGPAIAMGVLVWSDPESIHSLLDVESVQAFEEMYGPRDADERGSAGDFAMFGFYVYNNVGVAFRTFAGGLLAGIGTAFFLTSNGLVLGAVAAHLTREGQGEAFWSFVVGHGAFELTAIVIAGVAGLRLGLAILAPGRRRRSGALREAARTALPLVVGVAALLVVAAFVEAFWSSATWPDPATKGWAGAAAWLGVGAYLAGFGREHGS
jgi:uncharacterized membrane protein SpoIIM required for sporulation